MSQLERAMDRANERKLAGVGDSNEPGVVFSDGEFQDRAIFCGFDIEYPELVGTSSNVAEFYIHAARFTGLRGLFVSAWCDGLLTGLMLASLPKDSE